MNILIVTNNLYPNLNANSEIAYRLGAELKNRHGHEVTILGYSDTVRKFENNKFGLEEYEIAYIGLTRSIMAGHEAKYKKLFRLIKNPSSLLYFIRCQTNKKHTMANEYTKFIRRINRKKKLDCIVCFKNPNETIQGAISANTKIPIIAYELDPWESEEMEPEELREFQYSIEQKCAAIITTKLLYPTYNNWKIPMSCIYKADFPNIIKHSVSNINMFDDGKIHCVFAGQLYEDIRNPQYTVDLFSKLPVDIVLDIFGNDNGCLNNIDLPDNIVYHGLVDSDTAFAYLQSAKVVVNIGNTLLNQMPSKILTYISLGKPILNITKSPECPTLSYTQRYPLVCNIVEDNVSKDIIDDVYQFCINYSSKHVDFSWIKKEYYAATPEYVGGLLNSIIDKYVNINNQGTKFQM